MPLLSICCVTYNHKKYIRQCLDSFLMQKTNFKFEIIIHDDASTDGTADIIKEYYEKYPDIIKPIFQTENQFSQGKSISKTFIYPRIKGKYVALCEGDDYWTDPYKLQKQVDFLEANPDYSICFHSVKVTHESASTKSYIYPQMKKSRKGFTFNTLLNWNFIQTNSVVYRWRFHNENFNDIIPDGILPGDWYLHLCHAKIGKIGFLRDVMSVYRRHPEGIWSDSEIDNRNRNRKYGTKIIKFHDTVYKKMSSCSKKYLNNIYLPTFIMLTDNYISFGDIDILMKIKDDYPDIWEKSLSLKHNQVVKEKKYKRYYKFLLIISAIEFLILILLLIYK